MNNNNEKKILFIPNVELILRCGYFLNYEPVVCCFTSSDGTLEHSPGEDVNSKSLSLQGLLQPTFILIF